MSAPRARVPLATYRLQFTSAFNFQEAARTAEYLRDLGVSDAYASPLFAAESPHGYDVVRFDQFNPALGTAEDFEHLAARLRELDLGLLLDMVPNHMGNALSNAWWLDLLEKGTESPYSSYFDVQFLLSEPERHEKVLLPILEDHYSKVLEAGKLKLVYAEGGFAVAYYDRRLPLSPPSYAVILHELLERPAGDWKHGPAHRAAADLRERLSHWEDLPAARLPDFASLKEELAALYREHPAFASALEETLRALNGVPGDLSSFQGLDALLLQQHYRLAYWRVGPEEINYRRFFDITDLVSLRMELREVFEATHQLVLRLLKEGSVTGLRIDHPDGLWDPRQYFRRIQDSFNALQGGDRESAHGPPQLYVVAEKILAPREPLPADWPVAGTTGYDFLNCVNGVLVDSARREAFDRLYQEFAGGTLDYKGLVWSSKERILTTSLISELNALAQRLKRIAVSSVEGQDFTLGQIHDALAAVIASFPVYRTYVEEQTTEIVSPQREYIEQAIADAKGKRPQLDSAVVEFIHRILLLKTPVNFDEAARRRLRRFVMRFQQLTGPVAAKGIEDTAFYNFNRFISLNEVGGDPEIFGAGVEPFHRHNQEQAEHWPHTMLATATHDTKRGEDLRARLAVLSEMPEEWEKALHRWRELNADKKSLVAGQPAPHPNDEYFFYQTLVGAWPMPAPGCTVTSDPGALAELRARLSACMLKSIREAKCRTSWVNPVPAYEEATTRFVEVALAGSTPYRFLDEFGPFQRRVAFFGQFNSLSQVLLKLASPGVPDFYQGSELWDFNLVDPDNRRPVDFDLRRRLLAGLKASATGAPREFQLLLKRLLEQSHTGEIKMYLIWRALSFRASCKEVFEDGRYAPLSAIGRKQNHVCAFVRGPEGSPIIAVAPRLPLTLAQGLERPPLGEEVWEDTALVLPEAVAPTRFRNVLTEETISVEKQNAQTVLPLSRVLASFPVALLSPDARENSG